MKQDLSTKGLPCLKQKNMRQKAMAQSVCIASSRAVVAAVGAAAAAAAAAPAAAAPAAVAAFAAAAAPAAGHHEECGEGQATNSACRSAESLVGTLVSTTQSKDRYMLAV